MSPRHEYKMKRVTHYCSRCNGLIEGGIIPIGNGQVMTSGFIKVNRGYWSIYGREGEKYLCDDCYMQAFKEWDRDYLATHERKK